MRADIFISLHLCNNPVKSVVLTWPTLTMFRFYPPTIISAFLDGDGDGKRLTRDALPNRRKSQPAVLCCCIASSGPPPGPRMTTTSRITLRFCECPSSSSDGDATRTSPRLLGPLHCVVDGGRPAWPGFIVDDDTTGEDCWHICESIPRHISTSTRVESRLGAADEGSFKRHATTPMDARVQRRCPFRFHAKRASSASLSSGRALISHSFGIGSVGCATKQHGLGLNHAAGC